MAKKNEFSEIETFIQDELNKYDHMDSSYRLALEDYVGTLQEAQDIMKTLREYKEQLVAIENKNKI